MSVSLESTGAPSGAPMPSTGGPVLSREFALRTGLRDLMLVLLAAWAARFLFILIVPSAARSVDAFSWETVDKILANGGNPYQATTFLNWPPLWMQLIFCVGKIAAGLGIPFFRALQMFLILVESVAMAVLLQLIREVTPAARAGRWVMIGLALNPIAVLLVCQHCNFDVLVALCLLLFLRSQIRHQRTENVTDWLLACCFLGFGILTKTVPLVLAPMLAGGFRRVPAAVKILGLVLLLGPVVLGMSIIYVLAPADVTAKVLLYRSQTGYFGFGGLTFLAGVDGLDPVHSGFFYAMLAAVLAGSWIFFWRRNCLGGGDTILYAALVLAAIPSLGPGYATQYIYWFMPLLVATCACQPRWWRLVVAGFGLVAIGTYVVEYALLPEYGQYLFYLWPADGWPAGLDGWLISIYARVDSELGRTLLRLPIFAAYLVMLALGGGLLLAKLLDSHNRRLSPKGYALAVSVLLGLSLTTIALAAGHASVSPLDPASRKTWETAALNNLAWKFATGPDAANRNGLLAVKAAGRACAETHYQRPVFVGTLAAAYAEAGQFNEAVAMAQKAADLAASEGDTNLVKINQTLGAMYQGHQAYHEPPP